MDDLKKYLQQHRDDMDMDDPGETVWENISRKEKSAPAKNKVIVMVTRFAAAAAILSAVFFGVKMMNTTTENASSAGFEMAASPAILKYDTNASISRQNPASIDSAEFAPANREHPSSGKKDQQYALMNSFRENYSQLVNYQLSNIRSTPVYGEDAAYFNDFTTRLRQMDIDEVSIRRNIKNNGISNVLIEQLINVYQQKLDVLKSLQSEINKMNTRVQQNHPSADSLDKFYLNI